MPITRETLRSYQHLLMELDAIDAEIEELYNTYKSPQLVGDGFSRANDPGNPIARALSKIERKRKERDSLVQRLMDIEDFVQAIDDPQERAICRVHYIAGYTWEATCVRLRKHHSLSVVQDYDRNWWSNHRAE